MFYILLTPRQERIIEMVKAGGPLTGEQLAERVGVSRAALRPDLAILIMSGVLDARPKVGYYYTGKGAFNMLTEEISCYRVRDIQSVPVVVSTTTSAYDTIVAMFLEDVGSIFVVEPGGILRGVVSRKDLLKAAMGSRDLQKIPVKVLMTGMSKMIMTDPEEPVLAAAKKLVDGEIDSLPVVRPLGAEADKAFEVVGRVTKTNITRLLVEMGQGKRR